MSKILHFGRSCKAYLRLYEERAPEIKLCCEECGRSLHKHGRYYRMVTTKHCFYRIPIYRLYCPDCGKTISLLPDFLVPWARYATWVREAVITRKIQGRSYRQVRKTTTVPAVRFSLSTMKRWWKRHIHTASSVALWIAEQLTLFSSDRDLLRMYPSHVAAKPVDTLLWLQQLLSLYTPVHPWRQGYWALLNSRMPGVHLL
ncbi:DUF6431 domain-containing protein [Paenibacillus harenae]|uniref:DUF6431 domain-containing protein n=1 Tax=Paenibacillus harenae TaxID=306543 RepID=A0ABT9U390_PAEHA|nr:hypothetical protein [Paenibacillus harenae]